MRGLFWYNSTSGTKPLFWEQRSSRAYALTVVCFAVFTVSVAYWIEDMHHQLITHVGCLLLWRGIESPQKLTYLSQDLLFKIVPVLPFSLPERVGTPNSDSGCHF